MALSASDTVLKMGICERLVLLFGNNTKTCTEDAKNQWSDTQFYSAGWIWQRAMSIISFSPKMNSHQLIKSIEWGWKYAKFLKNIL